MELKQTAARVLEYQPRPQAFFSKLYTPLVKELKRENA